MQCVFLFIIDFFRSTSSTTDEVHSLAVLPKVQLRCLFASCGMRDYRKDSPFIF